jgi:hypothetical protein
MRRQRGAVELIVLVIIGAAVAASFAGLWGYYKTRLNALEKDIEIKQATITRMATEKAEVLARETALKTANENFVVMVDACRGSITELQRERNQKTAEAVAAQTEADRLSLQSKTIISDILAKTAGINWCSTWAGMVTDYVALRRPK